MSNEQNDLYEFDKFRLDVSERILSRGNERIPLSEKAFDTLCCLVRHANHLVGKNKLLSEVWADAIVEENNLDKNISLLRQVLGERAGNGKFIETVRGHGYRFIAEVILIDRFAMDRSGPPAEIPATLSSQPIPSDTQFRTPSGANRKMVIGAAVLLMAAAAAFYLYRQLSHQSAATAPIRTVAVLPFKPLVTGERNEALELGMAETLISKLSRNEKVTVRPLSSVRRYIGLEQDSIAAGNELNVESVLDGTIQTAGDRIRVSAKLLRVGDGKQLWAGQFDEKFTDIFAVQDSISERVGTALQISLGDSQKKRYTENVEAYQLYMKGRFHVLKTIKSETETGVSYFQRAIDADPNYALAYVGLADAYRGLAVGGEMPSADFFPKAKAAANRAIEIDDTLAEAHAILGHIMFWYDWDWNGAEREFQRALELDPSSADALQFYSHLLSCTGRHAEALEKIKLAREMEPVNLRINAVEGMLTLYAGQPDEAMARLQKTLELDQNFRLANMMLARVYVEKRMFNEAIATTRKVREISADGSEPVAYVAYALAGSGRSAEARADLDEMLRSSGTKWVPPYNIALSYNALGENSKALDHLEKAFAEKDVRMVFLKVETRWNNLRNEPRFASLMRKMNLAH